MCLNLRIACSWIVSFDENFPIVFSVFVGQFVTTAALACSPCFDGVVQSVQRHPASCLLLLPEASIPE